MNKAVEKQLYGLVAFWMQRPMGKNQSGFTLIETVIVMMVVALLFFSVLKGTGMVHQAKVRKTAQMVEDIRTASNLFYREQGRLPGDGPSSYNIAGVLDGWIDYQSGNEPAQFRRELVSGRYLVGKINGAGANKWQTPLGGEIWVELRSSPVKLNYIVLTGIAVGADSKFLDLQFDDGDPANGFVLYIGTELLIPL